jgi:rubredoxin
MPLLTLGQAIARKMRLIVWCKTCLHRFEPDMAELAQQHSAETTALTWARQLRCTQCGARDADFVVSGTEL